jgi:hypothetical protein
MPALLAVDVGLHTGLALYRDDGRLAWYRSQHFGNMARLRRGVHGLLGMLPEVDRLVLEGGGPIAEVWAREARRRGCSVRRVAAERWRTLFFIPSEHGDRDRAKRSALALARRVIAWSGAPRPTSLGHDAAEAILVGLWGVLDAGWLAAFPGPTRPG